MTTVAVPYLDSPPLERFGLPELVLGASPTAGAAFTQAVDGINYVRLVSVFFRLVTDANVANRVPFIEYLSSEGLRFAISGAPLTVTASTTTDFYFSSFRTYADWPIDSTVLTPLEPTILSPAMSFKISATSIQATDQISRVRFVWERFFTSGQPPGAY